MRKSTTNKLTGIFSPLVFQVINGKPRMKYHFIRPGVCPGLPNTTIKIMGFFLNSDDYIKALSWFSQWWLYDINTQLFVMVGLRIPGSLPYH